MNIFSLRLSGLAFAALLAGSAASLGTPVRAAGPADPTRPPSATVRHADLNLASAAGVRRLQARIPRRRAAVHRARHQRGAAAGAGPGVHRRGGRICPAASAAGDRPAERATVRRRRSAERRLLTGGASAAIRAALANRLFAVSTDPAKARPVSRRRILKPFPNLLAAGCAVALAACSMSTPPPNAAPAALMTWPDLLERPRPEESAAIAYGADSMQVGGLFLPDGPGPHPTVLMVHGGCWQTEIADRRIMNWIADDLRTRGIAVWNIDYRGVDREGGGYPGTFLDAAAAADALRTHAARYNLDIEPLVAIGHSAGGHLALWLAGRHRLPAGSPLRTGDPLPIHTVVSLGGLPDLEEAARPPGSGCGTDVIGRLTGGNFADTSVPRLGPIGAKQVLINGLQDRIIPTDYAEGYAAPMRAKGDEVKVRLIDATGHVELIAPETAAWAVAVEEIEHALGR